MSEPSAITGLPLPHVAMNAVGMPATPSSTVKPFFFEHVDQVLRRLELLKAQLAVAEDLSRPSAARTRRASTSAAASCLSTSSRAVSSLCFASSCFVGLGGRGADCDARIAPPSQQMNRRRAIILPIRDHAHPR